jgi:hypothetical protein
MVETRSGRKTGAGGKKGKSKVVPLKRKARKEPEEKKPRKKMGKKEEEPEEEVEEVEEAKEEPPKKKQRHATASESKKGKAGEAEEEPEILEKGLIYFFYKPKVELKEAHGPEDVQRLYLLLWPGAPSVQADEKKMTHHEGKMGSGEPERLIVLGKKQLPDVHHGKHERFWGFVEKVSRSLDEVEEDLEARSYTTKTRGERHVEGARPVGEGVYGLVKHHGHIHLAYVLEIPDEPSTIQKAFNIAKEGSFIITVKNPDLAGEYGGFMRSSIKVHYPEHAKKLFLSDKTGNPLKFAPANPQLLDYDGAELVFVGAAEDLKAELGETGEYIEELEEIDAKKISSDKIWKELHMSKASHPTEPLLRGKWK